VKVVLYSVQGFERPLLERANARHRHDLDLLDTALDARTAALARVYPAVSIFVHDRADAAALEQLASGGTRLLALRSAGFNHVDVEAADRLGIAVMRVPGYSPQAVAEHALALILTLDRKIHRAYLRVREGNFSLDGLMGFDLHGTTVGIVGTGRIGTALARILHGMGCRLLGYDRVTNDACRSLGLDYVALDELLERARIVSLHCPLTPETHHLIDDAALARMQPGAMLVNTSRGAVCDTPALIRALKSRRLGALGLDVYEEEDALFFRDLSDQVIEDDVFARLLTFPNVVLTAHQAFFTEEAVSAIEATTLENIATFERGEPAPDRIVRSADVMR